ncbi:hypothetical protein [Kitasatospora terrestris]
MPKKPLNPGEHQELGAVLAGIRNELLARGVQVASAYARTGPNGAAARRLTAAVNALDDARAELDRQFFREFPETATPQTYYPGHDAAAVVLRGDLQRAIMASPEA